MHGINDQLHLLVYDIMHSAYVNGYYPKGFSRTQPPRNAPRP